ncbi:sulfurtransferase complex subunit TusB [Citrobacter rodentium]|uniref:Protein TusB n=2 Tax=Citrobacter rodentium TaxID=67825 RepID=D2TMF7_CITRI|nr:sulfurtransferase complex subunit TusB [Citrobacter rodentium]KIQ48948.1 sulfur transfer complex subunit TusB [Citrobacter rodentium]QBY30743.1 sulfurtransferase complex subunit TusB [Citrobacter rodentium]UHO31888.1 sulfurtransferase complex subunit TusB [Citrobacter rodentium NBRC 105723 = DSM 16636]CBG91171.1 tRNA 2-thiouridine synthesizing protein B [Citrobacter rodentium ICC168]HAT8011204.1 sulfurtransferase TusB [Citrobacter rodentium NBRC 105723 = DSM 16636]
MLHTLRRSPWHSDFSSLLRLLAEGDALLLLQDGVIAAIEGSRYLETLRNAPITVYALQEDIDARGLTGQISDSVVRVSYTDFVRLTVAHASQLAW